MNELELLVVVLSICWLLCSWRIAIEKIRDIYRNGWRAEMSKVRKEAVQMWKDAFSDDEEI